MKRVAMAAAESKSGPVWRAGLIATLAGALGALALPPFHIVPVLFASFWLLLGLIDASPGAMAAARLGWLFGFGLNLVGLYWITEAIMLEAARFWWFVPIAVPALAAVMAVFVGVATLAARLAPAGLARILVLAGAWVVLDLARQFVGTGFPWNPLGSVWELPGMVGDVLIQPAAWIGVHGLTLATVLVCSAPVLGRSGRMFTIAAVALWAAAGTWRLEEVEPVQSAGPRVTVELIQGNVSQGLKWDQAQRLAIFDRYLRLSKSATAQADPGTFRVVIWPETASPFLIDGDPAARAAIASAVNGAWSLIGAIRFDADGQPRNSLIALAPDGDIVAEYDKWHLVPFGEYQPSWLPIGIQVVPGGGLRPGIGPQVLTISALPAFSPLICYETIFSAQVTPAANRPSWIVNITNDAWFGNSTGPRQHLAAARMRAVEEGLPLVRAANTGISAAFDAHGRELGRIELGVTGSLSKTLPEPLPPTLYSRLGLFIPGFLSLGALGAALVLGQRRRALLSGKSKSSV